MGLKRPLSEKSRQTPTNSEQIMSRKEEQEQTGRPRLVEL